MCFCTTADKVVDSWLVRQISEFMGFSAGQIGETFVEHDKLASNRLIHGH